MQSDKSSSKNIGVIILIIVLILIAAYVIFLFICYDTKYFIFSEWEQSVPANGCNPLIKITPLSDEQMDYLKTTVPGAPVPSTYAPT